MERRELLGYLGTAGVALHPGVQALATLQRRSAATAALSPGIFLNQLGYLPSGDKKATLRSLDASTRTFQVRSISDNALAFQGKLTETSNDALSSDQSSAGRSARAGAAVVPVLG